MARDYNNCSKHRPPEVRHAKQRRRKETFGKISRILRTSPAAEESQAPSSFGDSMSVLYIRNFSCLHKNKSRHEKSGERAGEVTEPHWQSIGSEMWCQDSCRRLLHNVLMLHHAGTIWSAGCVEERPSTGLASHVAEMWGIFFRRGVQAEDKVRLGGLRGCQRKYWSKSVIDEHVDWHPPINVHCEC